MAQEAWRAYLGLALGMTEASRKKATKAVKRLVGKGGATAEQLQALAEDLLSTSATNREGLRRMVRAELDRTLAKVGLATADEVAVLATRVRELEEALRQARSEDTPPVPPAKATTQPAKAAKPIAKKTALPKATVKRAAPVKRAASTQTSAAKAAPGKAATRSTAAKSAVSARKSAPARTSPARKSAPSKAAGSGPAAGTTREAPGDAAGAPS